MGPHVVEQRALSTATTHRCSSVKLRSSSSSGAVCASSVRPYRRLSLLHGLRTEVPRKIFEPEREEVTGGEISSSCGCEYENDGLLGCCAV
jgi:hypothetical protein